MSKRNKTIILIIAVILLVALIIGLILINGMDKSNVDKSKNTTNTTTNYVLNKQVKNAGYNIIVNYDESKEVSGDVKLDVLKLENIVENAILVYDIKLKDSNNRVLNVSNTDMLVTIPYDNINNENLKIVSLNDNNVVNKIIDSTVANNVISFNTRHLGKFAIIIENSEEESTKTTNTTTKKSTTKTTNTTTKKSTTKKTTTTAPIITEKPTSSTTTTKAPTTSKVKTYSYLWSDEGDSAGKYYLYIIDENGNKVNGTVVISYKGTDYSETVSITPSGKLFVKSLVSVSNVKGN